MYNVVYSHLQNASRWMNSFYLQEELYRSKHCMINSDSVYFTLPLKYPKVPSLRQIVSFACRVAKSGPKCHHALSR